MLKDYYVYLLLKVRVEAIWQPQIVIGAKLLIERLVHKFELL